MQWWTIGGEVGGGSPSRDLDPPCYSPSQITASPTQPFLSWTPLPGMNFTPLPQKFWLPYLKIFAFCKKVPLPKFNFGHSPFQNFWVGLPYLKHFDSPTWKFLNFEPHSDSPSSILGTPPLRISELDSPTWKIWTPLVEKKITPKKGQIPQVEFFLS